MSNNFAAECLASLGFRGSPYPDTLPISYRSLHRMFSDIGERLAQAERAAGAGAMRSEIISEIRGDIGEAFRAAAHEALSAIDVEKLRNVVLNLSNLTPEQRAARVQTKLISEAIKTANTRKATTQ